MDFEKKRKIKPCLHLKSDADKIISIEHYLIFIENNLGKLPYRNISVYIFFKINAAFKTYILFKIKQKTV